MLVKGKLASNNHPVYPCLIKHFKQQEQVNHLELTFIQVLNYPFCNFSNQKYVLLQKWKQFCPGLQHSCCILAFPFRVLFPAMNSALQKGSETAWKVWSLKLLWQGIKYHVNMQCLSQINFNARALGSHQHHRVFWVTKLKGMASSPFDTEAVH